jgi:hypothetical protein
MGSFEIQCAKKQESNEITWQSGDTAVLHRAVLRGFLERSHQHRSTWWWKLAGGECALSRTLRCQTCLKNEQTARLSSAISTAVSRPDDRAGS